MAESLGRFKKLYASGLIEGRRINSVSLQAEAWLWRLMMLADDHGNLPGDTDLLRGRAAPLRKISPAQVRRLTEELETANLITRYSVDGEDFINLAEYERMQTPPNGRRIARYPQHAPSGGILLDPKNPGESGVPETRTRPDQNQPGEQRPEPDQSAGSKGRGVSRGGVRAGGSGGSARLELEHLGVGSDMAAKLARAGVTPEEVRETIAETRADRRVKSPVRAMIARLAAAHGVELKGGNNISAEARSLQSAIDGRRQRA